MIVVFSTSSPIASIAAFEGGRLVFARSEEARQRASEAILGWYRELREEPVQGFVADLGPGGFTGTRVGIVAAKTLGFALNVRCAGVSAFDLIEPGLAAIPARRGTYLTREGLVEGWPEGAQGYGPDAPQAIYPQASRAERLLEGLTWVEPTLLVPDYRVEPSISVPKKPQAGVEGYGRVA